MKINLLVCDWFEGTLPEFLTSFPELFYNLFDSVSATPSTYQLYDVQKGELPDKLETNELYLISGSRAGAYEQDGWIDNLRHFIRRAHRLQIKMVGICFGHQLIAQALGGKVELSPKGWGAGIRSSKVVLPRAETYFTGGEMRLFYNHNDQVVQLPAEAERIATSDFCENEGFVVGRHILCFQGHPEYTAAFAQHLLDSAHDVSPEVLKRAHDSILRDDAMGREAARWMMNLG
ncbi:glutamine amidotransferase-related protein [Bacteroides reticulotermitis]|uniref:Glutamine amidotransferase n=2 Tax=Bacteroides reticulotermitis TaxID=1133319 RepID=W4UUV8_9BACE|nr:hypothetical protein [Bacteroides reticulotermitis]MBB4042359.1 GMP synthase-like glutamine amidotransferase [Bacteroides reticulotermitis]GAE84990.1 glutamine amidotransferase [Bacteroides reticulotermitis JCM 10512]